MIHDYSMMTEEDFNGSSLSKDAEATGYNFPAKLHYILSELEKDGLDHVMSWQPHGRSFRVHNRKALEETVIPRWFRESKYASFQRQLNLYGFTRITKGVDQGAYFHELFLRGKSFLTRAIVRRKEKGHSARLVPAPVPNFYLWPSCPPDSLVARTTDRGGTRETSSFVKITIEVPAAFQEQHTHLTTKSKFPGAPTFETISLADLIRNAVRRPPSEATVSLVAPASTEPGFSSSNVHGLADVTPVITPCSTPVFFPQRFHDARRSPFHPPLLPTPLPAWTMPAPRLKQPAVNGNEMHVPFPVDPHEHTLQIPPQRKANPSEWR